jgi:expansin
MIDMPSQEIRLAYWMAIQIRGAAFPAQSVSIRPSTSSMYTNLKQGEL